MTKAYIFTATNPVGDDKQSVYTWDDWSEPTLIQVHNTVILVKDSKVVMRIEAVQEYKLVDNYEESTVAAHE